MCHDVCKGRVIEPCFKCTAQFPERRNVHTIPLIVFMADEAS